MKQNTEHFSRVIENLHQKAKCEKYGINSTLSKCKYSQIKDMQKKRLREVPIEVLRESTFQTYEIIRSLNHSEKYDIWRGVRDMILEFSISPARYMVLNHYHSKTLKSF